MSTQTIKTTFKLRRGEAQEWESKNPALAEGEPAFEVDTGKLKIGASDNQLFNDAKYIQVDYEDIVNKKGIIPAYEFVYKDDGTVAKAGAESLVMYVGWDAGGINHYNKNKPRATSSNCLALGPYCEATYPDSAAFNYMGLAHAARSFACGRGTEVLGAHGAAFNRLTKAGGVNSAAFGLNTAAYGYCSAAFGQQTYVGIKLTKTTQNGITYYSIPTNAEGSANVITPLFATIANYNYEDNKAQPIDAEGNNVGEVINLTDPEQQTLRGVAFGYFTVANGENALAAGYKSIAVGKNSIALGYSAQAQGENSLAFGFQSGGDSSVGGFKSTIAAGDGSLAFGYKALAQGVGSIAIGRSTVAKGEYSFAGGAEFFDDMGYFWNAVYNTAIGNNSFAFGAGVSAIGNCSVALGEWTTAEGKSSFAGGSSIILQDSNTYILTPYKTESIGANSLAFGGGVQAKGDYSVALGYLTQATGKYSFAGGGSSLAYTEKGEEIVDRTVASGEYSFAFGDGAKASGNRSVALGGSANANAQGSIAMGSGAYATGVYSFALGVNSRAQGYGSVALGYLVKTNSPYALATGYQTNARQSYSATFNYKTKADAEGSFAANYSQITAGNYSATFNISTIKQSDDPKVTTPPNYSFAINRAICTGSYAFAGGGGANEKFVGATASGQSSFAFGYQETEASGVLSIAFGQKCFAKNSYSFAGGLLTTSSGTGSFAYGSNLKVEGDYCVAFGQHNVNTWTDTDGVAKYYLLSIGDSTQVKRNAFAVGDDFIEVNNIRLTSADLQALLALLQ